MLKHNLAIAAASAFLLAASGVALAQNTSPSGSSDRQGTTPTYPQTQSPSTGTGSSSGMDRSTTPGATTTPGSSSDSTSSGTTTTPPGNTLSAADIEGKDVVNANGDIVGTVEGVVGNNVILSVGGFLGMGKKHVSVPSSALTMSGVGDDAELVTTLTEEELKAMPEYEKPSTGTTTR